MRWSRRLPVIPGKLILMRICDFTPENRARKSLNRLINFPPPVQSRVPARVCNLLPSTYIDKPSKINY
jgi:hypothetical protein